MSHNELKKDFLEQVVGGTANTRRYYCPNCSHCFGTTNTVLNLDEKGKILCPKCNKEVVPTVQ